jgi:hypothetical protein
MSAQRRWISVAAAIGLTLCVWVAPASANNYTPSGTIVAESGFRPDTNGYSFPNYGNEDNPQNLDVNGMQKLFGAGVCAGGNGGADCTLTPPAVAWKDVQNKGMGGGHCEGFAISSSLFYAGLGEPSTPEPFGAGTVPALSLSGNAALQAHIAYTFVFQFMPSVSTAKVNGSPAEVLAALAAALPSKEPLVLGVYKRGLKDGHAITPLAIEDRGDGKFAVLVYDNNFPNAIREVDIDQNANTWNYTASTNPSEQASVYEGDASSHTLEIEYAKNGLGVQPCPFCGGGGSAKAAPKGLAAGDSQMGQLFWEGNPRDGQHSEVSIVDNDGNVAGSIGSGEDSELISDIPGVEVVPVKLGIETADTGVDVWNESPPPVFNVPEDLRFQLDFNGDGLDGSADEGFSLVRDGVTFTLDDLNLDQGDDQQVEIGSKGLSIANAADHNIAPTLSYADLAGGDGYEVTVRTNGLDADSTLDLTAKPGQRRLKLNFDASGDDDARVTTVVTHTDENGDVDKAHSRPTTIDGGETETLSYSNKALRHGTLEFHHPPAS